MTPNMTARHTSLRFGSTSPAPSSPHLEARRIPGAQITSRIGNATDFRAPPFSCVVRSVLLCASGVRQYMGCGHPRMSTLKETPTISYIPAFFSGAGPKCRPIGFSAKNPHRKSCNHRHRPRISVVLVTMGRPIMIFSTQVSKSGVTRVHTDEPSPRGLPSTGVTSQTQTVSGEPSTEMTLRTPGWRADGPRVRGRVV